MRQGRMPRISEDTRAAWPELPAEAEWAAVMTHIVGRQTQYVGVIWTEDDPHEPEGAVLRTHLFDVDGFASEEMTAKESYWAQMLVVRRAYDVIRMERQGRVLDYREEGRVYDAKIAAVLGAKTR